MLKELNQNRFKELKHGQWTNSEFEQRCGKYKTELTGNFHWTDLTWE